MDASVTHSEKPLEAIRAMMMFCFFPEHSNTCKAIRSTCKEFRDHGRTCEDIVEPISAADFQPPDDEPESQEFADSYPSPVSPDTARDLWPPPSPRLWRLTGEPRPVHVPQSPVLEYRRVTWGPSTSSADSPEWFGP